MNDATRHAGDAPLYPIREVSRLTGVNAVTLRAWERRYGLIRPRRTPKGHRLYAREDIERIEHILQWLRRGVPVSQVRNLLERPERPASWPALEPDAGDWPTQRQQLLAAVESLDQERLDALFNQSLALYPLPLCLVELWQPALQQLEERWSERPGDALQRRTLESFLRTRIGLRLLHANREASGPTVLVMPLPGDPGPLWMLLAALAASDRGWRVQPFDAPLPIHELPLAVEHLHADALLLASGQTEKGELVRRQLPRLAEQLAVPVALCGPVACIHADELATTRVENLGDDLRQAMARLQDLLAARVVEPQHS